MTNTKQSIYIGLGGLISPLADTSNKIYNYNSSLYRSGQKLITPISPQLTTPNI
jgi:hypothetical protein